MITAGVALAAAPATTGVAVLAGGRVVALEVGADDDGVLALTVGAARVGIDCPLGPTGEGKSGPERTNPPLLTS